MIEIVPAIMPKSADDVRSHIGRLAGCAPIVQLDVMDGAFVEGKTWPYGDGGQLTTGGLPDTPKFEIDLMVKDPAAAIAALAEAQRFIVHIESLRNPEEFAALQERAGVPVGASWNLDTAREAYEPFVERADFAQVMGIARIGLQGEPFDERALSIVSLLRAEYPNLVISVDGGVDCHNARALARAGANRLAIGSDIFEASDPPSAYRELVEAANDMMGA